MPEGQRALLRLVISGSLGVMTLEFDRDEAAIHTASGVERLPVAPGEWIYNCVGPVTALVDLAQGRGVNLSPGEIGAATVAILAAMADSARHGGVLREIAS